MSYPSDNVLASTLREGGEQVDFWWVGFPGEGGAKVFKTDPHGMRWTLEVGSNHLVTQKVAAGLLRVSVMTINKWVREHKLGKQMWRNGVSVIPMRVLEHVAEQRGIFLRGEG